MTISPLPDPQTPIEPVELRIGRIHGNHPVSLIENTDLGVILGRGQEDTGNSTARARDARRA